MATRKSQRSRSHQRTRSSRKASLPTRRRSQSRRRGQPDAISLLQEDHRSVKTLFNRFDRSNASSEKERLAERICNELKLHARIEEEIFYPAVQRAISDGEIVHEAKIEHASAKDLIGQIEGSSSSDENYDALVKVLAEYIRHHVTEEEGEMFPAARRAGLDLVDLGTQLREHKRAETRGGLVSTILGRTGG